MFHLKRLENAEAVQPALDNGTMLKPYVAYVQDGDYIDWNTKEQKDPYIEQELTFRITSSGVIKWTSSNYTYGAQPEHVKIIEYNKNDAGWISLTANTGNSAPSISVIPGDVVKFRGNNSYYSCEFRSGFVWRSNVCSFTGTTAYFDLEGNIMSLVNATDFANLTIIENVPTTTALTADTPFKQFFLSLRVQNAENLRLPATTLAQGCYNGLFSGCSFLTNAPELPAIALSQSCYANMFAGCTRLTSAPVLPATTLAPSCYAYMFNGCTGLTSAPALPTTTLADYCYQYMFQGCKRLTSAPELPATTLASGCYRYMFSGCTSLNSVKAMFTTTPSTTYTQNWLADVSSTGTFYKNPSATWDQSITPGPSTVPANWTITPAS